MHRKGAENSAGVVEWVETSIRGDLWTNDNSKSQRAGLHDGGDERFEDLSRAEGAKTFIKNDQNRSD